MERDKLQVTHHTFCQNEKSYEAEKSNLPPERKLRYKLTKVASGERQIASHSPHFVRMRKVMK